MISYRAPVGCEGAPDGDVAHVHLTSSSKQAVSAEEQTKDGEIHAAQGHMLYCDSQHKHIIASDKMIEAYRNYGSEIVKHSCGQYNVCGQQRSVAIQGYKAEPE